jgi:hypothetical protein
MEEASGPIVYLTMSYGKADEVPEYAAALARAHGLVLLRSAGRMPAAVICRRRCWVTAFGTAIAT